MPIFSGKREKWNMCQKQYRTGLVIGKFMPFHQGHAYLIRTAADSVENLTVIVCDTSGYEIPAETRKSWIREAFPNVDVRILNHDKSLDSDSIDVSKKWADTTLDFLGFTPEVVFSSEDYGLEFAKHMGSKHVMVDKKRIRYLISGTQVRENPFINASWNMINKAVRSMYAIKIVIVGAESTGTTTLSEDLAKFYNTVWVQEYGRVFSEGMLYVDDPDLWESEDFNHIAKMQNRMEDRLRRKCNRLLICDTDSWATSLWHLRYMGFRSPTLENLSLGRDANLYIVTDVDIPFVQDGTRDGEHIRHWMHHQFIEDLEKSNKKFIVVSGSPEERLQIAISEINKLLQSSK